MFSERRVRKWFGKEIGWIFFRGYGMEYEVSQYVFPEEMVPDVNVFGSLGELRVVCEVNASLIVLIDKGWSFWRYFQFSKESPEE